MKKVEKVSIADISFTLDSDAYVSLEQYLNDLHERYDPDPDGGEIIADIEARVAELILSEQVYTRVVSKPLIDSIIAQLGTPEEIGDTEGGSHAGGATSAKSAKSAKGASSKETSIPRRLHRSADGRILGGVCSGLAKYLNISVVWVRIAFLLPLILTVCTAPLYHGHMWGGASFVGWSWVFFVIYVVLWAALPMARTPRQKLESRGERITPESIRQSFQEGARTPSSKKAASVAAEIFTVLGRIVLIVLKFVVALIGFGFLMGTLVLLVTMIVMLVNPASVGLAALATLSGMAILSPILTVALIMFCTMIPMIAVGFALLGAVFGWRTGRAFFGIALGLWLLAMLFGTVVIGVNSRYLRDEIRDGNVRFDRGWCDWDLDGEWDYRSDRDDWERRRIRRIESGRMNGSAVDIESVVIGIGDTIILPRHDAELKLRLGPLKIDMRHNSLDGDTLTYDGQRMLLDEADDNGTRRVIRRLDD